MTNTEKLQGKMREKGFTLKTLSSRVGLSPTGLFNKILVVEKSYFLTDTLADTLSLDGIVRGVEKLILKGAGACVYNKQFHLKFPP